MCHVAFGMSVESDAPQLLLWEMLMAGTKIIFTLIGDTKAHVLGGAESLFPPPRGNIISVSDLIWRKVLFWYTRLG